MLEGREVAGPYVRKAAARHVHDLEHAHERGLVWRPDNEGGRAQAFFPEILRLNGGQFEGRRFELLGFQSFIVGSLFGWLRVEDGTRRFRTGYVEIGKGNGKTPLAAGIGLYGLTQDGEARAEVYGAATTKDQAMVGFRDAVAMVHQSPRLAQRLVMTPADPMRTDNIGYPATGSWFSALAGNAPPSGPRPHFFLVDELHEHRSADVVNMASLGQKWRRQPLVLAITNSGFDRSTVCYSWHAYSLKLLDGLATDDEWFAYVCALDKGDDPFESEECWPKANPGLGHIIKADYLRKQVREARGMPARTSTVRRLNFCEWVGAENPWIDGALWMQTERPDMDGLEELAQCAEVVGALDLSGTSDLTALALAGERDGRTKARVEFWTPKDTLRERSLRDLADYELWVEQGYMTATPGRAVDYAWVAERLVDLQVRLPTFRRLAFDPYRIKYLEVELDRLNCAIELVPHPQGYYKSQGKKDRDGDEKPVLWMPRSIELLTGEVANGTLDVEANPALTHCSASAVLEADQKNNSIFTKRKSRGRIDGLVALAMAIGFLYLEDTADDGDLDDFINAPVIG